MRLLPIGRGGGGADRVLSNRVPRRLNPRLDAGCPHAILGVINGTGGRKLSAQPCTLLGCG